MKKQPQGCLILLMLITNFFQTGLIKRIHIQLLLLTLQVFKPIKVYNGQKLIKLVSTNTPASTNSTIPNVPVMVLVKYKTTITAASNNLTIRSVFPIFFFILFILIANYKINCRLLVTFVTYFNLLIQLYNNVVGQT